MRETCGRADCRSQRSNLVHLTTAGTAASTPATTSDELRFIAGVRADITGGVSKRRRRAHGMAEGDFFTESTVDYWQELTPDVPARFSATPPYRFGYPVRLPCGRVLVLPLRQLPDGRHAVASLIANQASHAVVAALADHMAEQARASRARDRCRPADPRSSLCVAGGRAARSAALRAARVLAQVLVRRCALRADLVDHHAGSRAAAAARPEPPDVDQRTAGGRGRRCRVDRHDGSWRSCGCCARSMSRRSAWSSP